MPENPPRVVRFSKSEHSIRTVSSIVLSSPSYYRKLEEKSERHPNKKQRKDDGDALLRATLET